MIKKFTLIMGLCFALTHVNLMFGQAGSYSFSTSSGTYTPLGAGSTAVPALIADAGEVDVPIGFSFDFEGVTYDTVAATSDCFLSFVKGATSIGGNNLDFGPSARRPLIAALWDDMDGRAQGSQASYMVSGTAPNRVFTFEWKKWEWAYNFSASDSVVSVQARLYETTNVIEVTYQWECSNCASGADASIGLSGANTFLSVTGVGSGTPTASNTTEDSNIDTIVDGQVFTFTPPACSAPTFTGGTVASTTSATVTWTTGAGSYEINWDTAGFVQGAATSNFGFSATNSFTATAMSAGTQYDFYVRRDCGGSVYSSWTGPFTLTTPYVAPYLEDWSGSYPGDWSEAAGMISDSTVFSSTTTSNWAGDIFNNVGSSAARINIYGSSIDEWLISPSIDLGTGTSYQLNFQAGLTNWNATSASTLGADDTVKVVISTDNGVTWSDTNTLLTLTSADMIANGAGSYYAVSLAGYSGMVKFAFYAESTASNADNDFFIDDIEVRIPPACPNPTSLADSNYTTTTADLGWQSGGSGPWYIYWGPCGFNQASPSQDFDTTTVNSHTLTGLTPGTSYQWYVIERCGSDLSDTIDGGCFRTVCGTQTIPYAENFDYDLGCFTAIDSGTTTDTWMQITDRFSNDLDGTGFLIADSDGAGSGTTLNEYLVSPYVDASAVTGALILEFDQYYNYYSGDKADVEVWDGTQWVNVLAQTGSDVGSFSNPDHQSIDITAYANDSLQVRFHYYDANWAYYWAIDNFQLSEVTCLESSSLAVYGLGSDSIAINWNPGDGINYGIEYGLTGFPQGSGFMVSTTDTFHVFKPLTPQTTYDFYLTDTCSSGFSSTIGPITVTTPCVTQSIPYNEDFMSALGCFIVTQNGGTSIDTWEWLSDYNTNTVDGSNGFAMVNSDAAGSGVDMDEILTSPTLDASSVTGSLILEFDQYYRALGDTAAVDVWDGTQWVNLLKQTSTIGSWGTPDHKYIDVTAYANANFKVRFHYYDANYSWYWAIDNFSVTTLPCGLASNLDTGLVLPNSAVIKWTSNGSLWNIEWGPQGFSQGSGSAGNGNMIRGVSSNPYTLTALGADSCYDFYVQDTCAGIGTGAWIGPFSFCTPPTCPAPKNLGVDPASLTINSADVYWTPGLAANFNVEYGPAGFVRGSGSRLQATNDTATISSLMSGTAYEFYVRDSCSATDTSKWAGPFGFVTPFNTNYLEDFTLANPFGWSEADGRLTANTVFTSTTNSSWARDNFANTGTNSSQNVNIYSSNQYEWIISPSIYLNPSITNLQVEFDVAVTEWISQTQGYLGPDDSLAVLISTDNGATWSSNNVIWYANTNDTIDSTGQHVIIPISSYSGYVKFGIYAGSPISDPSDNDWFIDNFEVRTPRACNSPTGIAISNITTDSAMVSWTAGTPGFLNAEVFYTVGNQPASSGMMVSSTNDSVILSGLAPSTEYCVYVVEQCANGYSDTIGPVCFFTECVAFTAPYYENFDMNGWVADNVDFGAANYEIGLCWAGSPESSSSYSWRVRGVSTGSSSTGPDTDSTGGNFVYAEASSGISGDTAMLISPMIDLSGLGSPELSFASYFYGADIDRMYTQVDAGSGWVTVDTILGQTQSSGTDTWSVNTIDLAAFNGMTITVRFVAVSGGCCGGDLAIDAFRVSNGGACTNPSNVVATMVSCDTVNVSWTSDTGSTSSTLVYGPRGFGISNGTVVSGVSSPYMLSGLALNTEYDVYIVDSCAAGSSNLVGPISVKTDSLAPLMAAFASLQSDTNYADATLDFDASASTGDGITYDWDFGNSTTGSGANASATYTANGSYSVTLTVTDRCGNTDDTTITIAVGGISIIENDFNVGIDVYPNPSSGNFKVRISGQSASYAIEVTDLSGKVVHRRENLEAGKDQEIDLGEVASGVYLVRITGKGLNASQRIMID